MSSSSQDDRRSHDRIDVRIPGAAFVLCESALKPIEVWTRNISAGGVSLLSRQELLGDRMLLQLPHPNFAGKLIVCNVRHRSDYERDLLSGEVEKTFVCGLKFERIFETNEVHPSLLEAFDVETPEEETETTSETPVVDEESMMPFLSAVGLAVVYSTML